MASTALTHSTNTRPFGAPPPTRDDRSMRRKQEARTDIWTNLLRQTREAQARSRSHSLQHRSLIVCGASPDDQRQFVQSLARPPPPAPPARNRDQRPQKAKGELRLSNRYAYGYGHVTLYSPPSQQGGAGLLGAEAEEAAHVEMHTLPEPDVAYEAVLRRLLSPENKSKQQENGEPGEGLTDGVTDGEDIWKPALALLLSWREPWRFLTLLRRWLHLLAQSLSSPESPLKDPQEVLKEHHLSLTIVVQHVEAQEGLEREGYTEESFDYISQCLRTCILPLSAALIYTSSTPPPQQPGSALSDIQRVVYTGLHLDLVPLSPAPTKSSTPTRREDLAPKHNVVDRMAIVVPSGWDSVGKIRLLSETFSPESVLDAWTSDLLASLQQAQPPTGDTQTAPEDKQQANAGAEQRDEPAIYTSSVVGEDPELEARPFSPSKHPTSAITSYESQVLDPNAHKAPKPAQIEVKTKPDQTFLAEIRTHLQYLEIQDAERAKSNPSLISTTAGSSTNNTSSGERSIIGVPSGEQSGALNDLGEVSFNVGGVSYNTVSAEAAIEALKRPSKSAGGGDDSSPMASSTPRTSTPRPPRREDRETASTATPVAPMSTSSSKGDLPVDKLEEYFHSLVKKGGGGGSSASSTPSKASQQR